MILATVFLGYSREQKDPYQETIAQLSNAQSILAKRFSALVGFGRFELRAGRNSLPPLDVEFAIDGMLQKVTRSRASEPDAAKAFSGRGCDVLCVGEQYSFRLVRERRGGEYYINKMQQTISEGRGNSIGEMIHLETDLLKLPFSVRGVKVCDLVNSDEFSIASVRPEEIAGESCVRIDFSSRFDGDSTLSAGFIVVQPSRNWALRKFSVQGQWANAAPYSGAIDYFEPGEVPDLPTPKIIRASAGDTALSLIVHKIDYRSSAASEFMLSHFGLPDMVLDEGRNKISIMLVSISLILAAAAIAMKLWINAPSRRPSGTGGV